MTLKVNSPRLWKSLMEMAEIGATARGGCNRQALTDLDIQARNVFSAWCESEGMSISYDAVGNMFARFEGTDRDLAPLVIGSHLDTQPTGGRFDGILGVLAGLEVIRTIREAGIRPKRSIEIANWVNEEGARFAPAMMGSGVFAGALDLADIRAVSDREGVTVGTELDTHGFSGMPHPSERKIHAYLELHIEQGPVLEAQGKSIGVVTGAQGIRWYDVAVRGREAHAGPTPMSYRSDPVVSLPGLVEGILAIGNRDAFSRATIGQIATDPRSRNVVPGKVRLSVDLRHPDEDVLSEMDGELHRLIRELTKENQSLGFDLHLTWHSPVVAFDPGLVRIVRDCADELSLDHQDIVSGAGHDALMVSHKVPTAMIFTPCRGGVSHNEAEHIEPEQAEDGTNVLLAAVARVCLPG